MFSRRSQGEHFGEIKLSICLVIFLFLFLGSWILGVFWCSFCWLIADFSLQEKILLLFRACPRLPQRGKEPF